MYDVIVIGAGPAGATAAKILAEDGRKVLLAEKFKLPRYKSCSGQLIKKSLDLVERYFGESVPESVTCSPAENRGMFFTDDIGRTFLFEQPGLNVWRSLFDFWLAKKAEAAGAILQDGQIAISFLEDCPDMVTVLFRGADGRTHTEYARYVIDGEGVIGTLKRQLTGVKPDYITTFQTFNQGRINLDPHYFYAYLQPELSEYDAWFNVKDNQLVLGVSVKNKEKEQDYYKQFIHYLENHHGLKIDIQIKKDRWLMPQINPGCAIDYGVGRVLFIGEIAGFLNPMGEGISAAMESAFFAAKAILQHEDDPKLVLASYQKDTAALLSYMKRQWSLVGGMAKTFARMR